MEAYCRLDRCQCISLTLNRIRGRFDESYLKGWQSLRIVQFGSLSICSLESLDLEESKKLVVKAFLFINNGALRFCGLLFALFDDSDRSTCRNSSVVSYFKERNVKSAKQNALSSTYRLEHSQELCRILESQTVFEWPLDVNSYVQRH